MSDSKKLTKEIRELCQKNAKLQFSYYESRKKIHDYSYYTFPEIPSFISNEVHHEIIKATNIIKDALKYSTALLLNEKLSLDGKPLWDFLDIPQHIKYWIKKLDLSTQSEIFWSRPDFIIQEGVPKFLEGNFASAAGYQMQVSTLIEYYLENPFYGKLIKEQSEYEDPLLSLAQSFSRHTQANEPIHFLDVREKKRYKRADQKPYSGMIALINNATDLKLESCFLDELDLKDDFLYLDDQKISKIFLSYYNPHVFEFDNEYSVIWNQQEQKKVFPLDSMLEILYSNKSLLAFLSEFIDKLPFQNDIQAGFKKYVPWSRIIRECKTEFQEKDYDLIRLLTDRQNEFVLKKSQSAEGQDVYIGKYTQPDAWKKLLEEALNESSWVVQEYMNSEEEKLYVYNNKVKLDGIDCHTTISPYFSESHFSGYLKRYIIKTSESSSDFPVSKLLRPELGTVFILK